MMYAIYASPLHGSRLHRDLCADNKREGLLYARAEESGCEGCYVEVARWDHGRHRWEKYCFVKFLGGEGGHPELDCWQLAERYAREINEQLGKSWPYARLIGALPRADDPAPESTQVITDSGGSLGTG